MAISIYAEITGIKYTPLLCRELREYEINQLDNAFKDSAFLLNIDEKNKLAVSWWVSPKRTRSYPYARVYDTLAFTGKKVTVIPIFKDEGLDGDRDFLQWDTVSLMSLLGIYTIISYYSDAEKNPRFENKITNQRFNLPLIKQKLKELISYQSDALHWNLEQLHRVGKIAEKALEAYDEISERLNVKMHSRESALKRIERLKKGAEEFKTLSRELAKQAQKREAMTVQPKEETIGIKGKITIKNYLGGYYYFTIDEIKLVGRDLYIYESKHSKTQPLPSLEDIKDGLLRMVLYTNLKNVKINGWRVNPIPILKLTTSKDRQLSKKHEETLTLLKKEAEINMFRVSYE
jgi:hypothetical protein